MTYHVGNGIWNGVFAVPNIVTDEHIKLASGLSIKILLLILRHNGKLEPGGLASMLGQSAADIQDAMNYWVESGLLSVQEPACQERGPVLHQLTPSVAYEETAEVPPAANHAAAKEAPRVQTLSSSRPRLSSGEINELAKQDENLAQLLQESQSVMGKPLSPLASSTLATLYAYSGMQPDLILMLAHYCVSIGKDSMRYIERMADSWVEKGIDSHEKAEAEILRLTEARQVENRIKSAFGIHDRSLITSEKSYIRAWAEDWRMELPLIQLAYERSVELKGKLSFAYINGILSNWHDKGVKTPAQAMAEIKGGRAKSEQTQTEKGSSYDIGELEKLIAHGDF